MDRESSITAVEAVDDGARVGGFSAQREPAVPSPRSPVMAWNEWDPLEEVIVGSLDGATIPTHHLTVIFNLPRAAQPFYRFASGFKYPKFMKKLAQAELDNFISILAGEGVKVRRPDSVDFSRKFKAPFWTSRGFCVACPRDPYLVIGDEIIESPMCWRSRYFEGDAYRSLFKEYFRNGARWTSAPRPQLTDDLYNYDYRVPNLKAGEPMQFTVNELSRSSTPPTSCAAAGTSS